MGPNVCSWRTLRVLTAAAALLFVLAGSVRSQEIRTNRVWSLHLSFKVCGATLESVRFAKVGSDGEIGEWQQASTELLIVQWSHNLPYPKEGPRPRYTLHDLLADFGQTRYVLQLIGRGSTEGSQFSKIFWLSPVGMAKEPIPKAPIRENRYEEWTAEELEAFSDWFYSHTLAPKKFFREFDMLMSRSDKKVDFPVIIKSNLVDCKEEEEASRNELRIVL